MDNATAPAPVKDDDRDVMTDFLRGRQDSFNYESPAYYPPHQSVDKRKSTAAHSDFISMVTTISQIYQKQRYLEMQPLDGVSRRELHKGRFFQVSSSKLQFNRISALNQKTIAPVSNQVVVKKTMNIPMTEDDVRLFNRELYILDYLYDCPNIIRLLGVGWFYRYDSLEPMPQPALVLEEARETLRLFMSQDISLTIRTIMSVFRDIANGLSVLHAHGIVHGDLKPENILLIPDYRYDEGVRIETFVAKISDFNLAVIDNGGTQRLLGGTATYQAPEGRDELTFQQLQLSDVYSLGILYAMVASGTDDVLEWDAIRAIEEDTSVPGTLEAKIIERAKIATEGSVIDRISVDLVRNLFRCTLRLSPNERDLDKLLKSFENYFGNVKEIRSPKDQIVLTGPSATDLTIGYGEFKDCSGLVKDRILEGLLEIISLNETDSRHPKALFELSVIFLSKFVSPTASEAEGLRYLWMAAESGDLRAKAFYGRLSEAYECVPNNGYRRQQLAWLSSAANAGFQQAMNDLQDLDPDLASTSMRHLAEASIFNTFRRDPLYSVEVEGTLDDGATRPPDTLAVGYRLHWAAGTGCLDMLVQILENHPHAVNSLNGLGDTPLLSAFRFGQYETAMALLSVPIDASICNYANENCLHFLWRFTHSNAQVLLPRLIERGADPGQQASSDSSVAKWSLVPSVAGSPIERLVAFNRLDLIKLLICNDISISPPNGNLMRRMLLLASRLQHTAIQKFLIDFACEMDDKFRHELRLLHDARWAYKGKRRSFLDAATLGWVRQTGSGVDIPIGFWQACYHGRNRLAAMKTSIHHALYLRNESRFDESLLDAAIQLTIEESAHEALNHLLDIKISLTDGESSRLQSLLPLCWHLNRSHSDLLGRFNRATHLEKDSGILGRSVMNINYVDQIFYVDGKGTLAQQALLNGDRLLFFISVHRFGANLTLPFKHDGMNEQINCFSAVTHTKHHDLWFIAQLYELNVEPCCPFDSHTQAAEGWETPLYHALCRRSWALSRVLMNKGENILSPARQKISLLEDVLRPGVLPQGLLEFLFPSGDLERSIDWCVPPALQTQGGYSLFETIYRGILTPPADNTSFLGEWWDFSDRVLSPRSSDTFDDLGLLYTTEEAIELAFCWHRLLKHYRNVRNRPTTRKISVLAMTTRLHAKVFSRAALPCSFDILLAPNIRIQVIAQISQDEAFFDLDLRPLNDEGIRRYQLPHQSLLTFFGGSPLDSLTIHEFVSSRLWQYNYWPSLWHGAISIPIAITILIAAFVMTLRGLSFLGPWAVGWTQTEMSDSVARPNIPDWLSAGSAKLLALCFGIFWLGMMVILFIAVIVVPTLLLLVGIFCVMLAVEYLYLRFQRLQQRRGRTMIDVDASCRGFVEFIGDQML